MDNAPADASVARLPRRRVLQGLWIRRADPPCARAARALARRSTARHVHRSATAPPRATAPPPRQARSAIAYVLNNWRRRHEHKAGATARRAAVDPYASGVRFDGWATPPSIDLPASYEPLPGPLPRSSLLTVGWRRLPLAYPL